MPLIDFLSGIM